MLSVCIGFFLYGVLLGVKGATSVGMVGGENLDRLLVLQSTGGTLAVGNMQQIRSVPGVRAVVPSVWIGGYFQNPRNAIFAVATDLEGYFGIVTEKAIASGELADAARTRTGAIVGAGLAKRFGWKVGDRIPLRSDIWMNADQGSWPIDILAIYEDRRNPTGNDGLFLSYDYLDQGRVRSTGTVDWFEVQIADAGDAGRISSDIDALFENSAEPTRTQTEKEFTQALLAQAGDITLIVTATLAAVFFTILIITGNAMIQAFRERRAEFAVLKALGFSNSRVLALIAMEATVLCLGGAAAGLGLAALVFPLLRPITGLASLQPAVIASGAALALAVGGLAALVPALMSRRVPLAVAMVRQ
jgi:putative ABC transport system permease protein